MECLVIHITNLNTTFVSLQLAMIELEMNFMMDLNTTFVSLQLQRGSSQREYGHIFKYNFCFSSTNIVFHEAYLPK